jgi:regulator of sigma E protease
MNFLLALLIFAGMNYSRGTILRETTTVGYVIDGSPAAHAGFQVGDRVTTVNTKPVSDWDGMIEQVYAGLITGDVTWSVVRAGTPVQLTMAHNAIPDPTQAPIGIVAEKTEIVISTVEPGKPADKLGLKPNDVLLAMSGTPVRYDLQVRELVHARAGQNLDIEWRRDGAIMRGTAVPTVDGKIGISFLAEFNGPVQRVRYGVFQSIGHGAIDLVNFTGLFLQQIWQIVVGKIAFSQSVGGPIKIAQMASQSAESGFLNFIGFVSILSISLAVLNILPLPALDGGHLLFLILEAIFRREIPVKVKLAVQRAGVFLLLAFMAFVLYNDIVHF